jgi:hypothetical protein
MREDSGMSKQSPPFQFGLRSLLLWTAVMALYLGLVVTVESENLEWLVLSCWPALILGLRFAFGPWISCHISAIGAGGVVAVRVFFPALPSDVFEVQYAFVQGCGIGYAVWLVVELVCLLVQRADYLLRSKGT